MALSLSWVSTHSYETKIHMNVLIYNTSKSNPSVAFRGISFSNLRISICNRIYGKHLERILSLNQLNPALNINSKIKIENT